MKSDPIGPAPAGAGLQEWRDGWPLVLSAALGVAVASSFPHFIGAMIKPLGHAYGWSRGEVALGLTLITSIGIIVNLVYSALADRIGPRRLVLWGSPVFGLAFCAWALAGPALWTWYFFCVVYAVFGTCASVIIWTMLVVKRFHHQRGLALALALSGSGLSVAVTPSLVILLDQLFSVRQIFMIWGIAGGLIMFVPALFFYHDRDAAIGSRAAAAGGHFVREALRDRKFWQLILSVILVAPAIGTFIVHIQPMLIDSGLTPAAAASVALFVGPSMIVGRVLMGALFDRIDARLVSALAFTLPVIACVLLGLLDGSYAIAVTTGIVIGLGLGAEVDVLAYLTSRYFGMRSYGRIYAIFSGLYGLGIGAGSALAGALHDNTGSYAAALFTLGCGALTAVVLVMLLGTPRSTEDNNSEHTTAHG
jgi:predicted MFS family arabinose efflux permease